MWHSSKLELKVPPIVVMFLTACLIFLASKITVFSFDLPANKALGWFCVIAGLIVIGRGVQVFRHHQTTVDPRMPNASNHLVTSDVHAML